MEKPIRDILLDTVPDAHIQTQWARQLRTAEAISERHVAGVDTVLLADEVGMGKTYVALAALSHYVFQTQANDRKVLLVVPPNNILSRKWEQDIRSFNESYLRPSVRDGVKPDGGKRLRHLVIKTYWDLIQNLHDFQDQDLERISEGQIQCFALSLWFWNEKQRKKGKHRVEWNAYKDMEEYSPEYLGFCSDFSQRALFDFLDEEKVSASAGMHNLVSNLNNKIDQSARLKFLLRKFGRSQDSYESNVFIIGMAALRTTRIDDEDSKLLNTYIVGMALKGRHRPTREAIIKNLEASKLLVKRDKGSKRKNHCDWVEDLGYINLWGLQEDVRAILDGREKGERLIDRLRNAEDIKSSLKEIQEAVIARKMRAAGIGLAVVDEVHNWKNGGNGAENFQKQYAPYIAKKLLLSATPFQIHEAELGKVFGFACGAESSSMSVINGLLGDSGVAKACLDASAGFLKRWEKLGKEDLALLQRTLKDASDNVGTVITGQALLWGGNESLEAFAAQVGVYREAIAALQRELSKVMIRHTKDRDKRHFHAGAEYRHQGRPDYDKVRRALYDVPGFGDTQNALINFLAMRVDQLVRRDKAEGSNSNVHLLGGITSSNQAFQDSNESLLKEKALSVATRAYLKFFASALLGQDHPKVKVTVERAYQNYRRGHKTLIFCERVGTLAEIVKTLNTRLTSEIFGVEGLDAAKDLRKKWLLRHESVELFWSRSYLETLSLERRTEILQRLAAAQSKLTERIKTLVDQLGITPNERQAAKLWDLAYTERIGEWERGDGTLYETLFMLGKIFLAESDDSKEALAIYLRLKKDGDVSIDEVEDHNKTIEFDFISLGPQVFDAGKNIWFASKNPSGFHQDLWRLLEHEISILNRDKAEGALSVLASLILDLPQGLRKVLLRTDMMPRYRDLADAGDAAGMATGLDSFTVALEQDESASKLTSWTRTREFLGALLRSEGSINRKVVRGSRRQSLWNGVFLAEERIVESISGSVSTDKRVRLCAAFNSPLAPDILVCTSIGSEGIDLHLHCDDIIHHDLPWNPAKLEQRIGRLDRVGSMAETGSRRDLSKHRLNIGIPFLAHNYEKFQYELILSRAQKFEILLGRPEFATDVPDEDEVNQEGNEIGVVESTLTPDVLPSVEAACSHLPESLIAYLRMDLTIVGATFS